MPVSDSPLRYPGGKTQLTPFVIDLLRSNDLLNGIYVEPFAGGAGIAWKLLLDNFVSSIWINDIDPAIYSFWASVIRHTGELCELIESTPVTIDEWHKQREVQKCKTSKIVELGFSTFFLNRTNRSGILKAGVIGGLEQNGNYLLDCRFNKKELLKKIQRIALYKERIKLTKIDAEKFIKVEIKKLPERSLINIDPPYYKQGPGLYCSFYKHEDHENLASAIKQIVQPWMLTYDDVPEIRSLYSDLPSISKSLNYSAQVKRIGVEYMVFSNKVTIPGLEIKR
jgi:DNA adenine methylase